MDEIDYRGYRIQIKPHGEGHMVWIIPPDRVDPLEETPITHRADGRESVLAEAQAIVDRDLADTGVN